MGGRDLVVRTTREVRPTSSRPRDGVLYRQPLGPLSTVELSGQGQVAIRYTAPDNGSDLGRRRRHGAVAAHGEVGPGDLPFGLRAATGSAGFRDVPSQAWYAPYVAAAAQAGLVQGLTPTRFGPNETMTREQMAVLLARTLKLNGTATLSFKDSRDVATWALQGVEEAVAAGTSTASRMALSSRSARQRGRRWRRCSGSCWRAGCRNRRRQREGGG